MIFSIEFVGFQCFISTITKKKKKFMDYVNFCLFCKRAKQTVYYIQGMNQTAFGALRNVGLILDCYNSQVYSDSESKLMWGSHLWVRFIYLKIITVREE